MTWVKNYPDPREDGMVGLAGNMPARTSRMLALPDSASQSFISQSECEGSAAMVVA
jgi:hypothetical protein